MAEESTNNSQPADGQAQQPASQPQQEPVMQLERCYFKDASLEMPHAPDIFYEQLTEQPTVDIQFEVVPVRMQVENRFEVTVRGTITVKSKDKTLFLAEGKQAGIFIIAGFTDEQMQLITNISCPAIIYPYLRANLADLITRCSMPPVHLPEVNFEALYQQRVAQQQAKAESSVQQPS
ncbi:protein-export chaperone SecB [Mesosutterella porci]|uniref:protein-export chaperone SecB n=1 Tax=Mesosutterella porci TaxID=2915351 RepID=UPI0024B4ED93|nr:protein-export chaperone SecB [Mesosutterella sp. oilRF-744-WT-GAM-9]